MHYQERKYRMKDLPGHEAEASAIADFCGRDSAVSAASIDSRGEFAIDMIGLASEEALAIEDSHGGRVAVCLPKSPP